MEVVYLLTMFGLLLWIGRKLEYLIHHRRPKPDFKVADIPLSSEQWKRFCSLAIAKRVSQKKLIAECVLYYLEQKVK